MSASHLDKESSYQQGIYVVVGLAAMTIVEYYAANIGDAAIMLLAVIALGKTALIAEFFMHFGALFQSENGGH
jgi:hypothetical protein